MKKTRRKSRVRRSSAQAAARTTPRRRSRRRAIVHANPRRSIRRSYRRNPPTFKSVGSMLLKGATDAAIVVGGKAATNIVSRLVPSGNSVAMKAAVQAGSALAIGFVGGRFLGAERGALLLAGGLSSLLESLVKSANVPYISAALGDDMIGEAAMGAYLSDADGMGSYYVEPAAAPAALPVAARALGEDYGGGLMYR